MADVRGQLHALAHNFYLLSLEQKCSDKVKLNTILDELNAIDYKHQVLTDVNAVISILKTICWIVSPSESFLVAKSCKLMCRLLRKYQIPQSDCSVLCIWLMKAITECNHMVLEDILKCLFIVLKTNAQFVTELYEDLIGKNGILFRILKDDNVDDRFLKSNSESPYYIELGALKCLQALTQSCDTFQSSNMPSGLTDVLLQKCSKVAVFYLYKKKHRNQDEISFCETLSCACNILIQIYSGNNDVERLLGEVIGACRCWMLYALDGCENTLPQKVMPSQQTVAELPIKANNKGGKRMKLRKSKNAKPVNNWKHNAESAANQSVDADSRNTFGYKAANESVAQSISIPLPQWAVTSESDMSDSESSHQAKLKATQANTRLAALNLLSVIIRTSEKHQTFGYWWALLPEDMSSSGTSGLVACLQKENSGTCRTAALAALLSLLITSRPYLAQAEASKRAMTAFTPFSVMLGHTLESLHTLLCQVLSSERHKPVLVAALKCVVACIQATPYTKLGGGMLTGIVKRVKILLTHRDWTIQVAALIVMGCAISVDTPIPEIISLLHKQPSGVDSLQAKTNEEAENQSKRIPDDYESDNCSEEDFEENETLNTIDIKCLDIESISFSPERIESLSWLVEICLENLGWIVKNGVLEVSHLALVTVRLESLQVLSAVALQHFELLMAPYLDIMTCVFCSSLRDQSAVISLHTAKCLSSMGDAMQKLDPSSSALKLEDSVVFWTRMLRGPLTELLQSEQNAPGRAIACDCISSIGERTLVKLPANLNLLCATLLLGSSGDDEVLVRAAAVRALSVCIMYRHWREDIGLLSDCGESVLRVITDPSPAVKIKATWALANITDALLLNVEDPEIESIDHNLFVRLLEESIAASKENDKIKMSAMRAIGNIMLRFTEADLQKDSRLHTITLTAIERLVYCASNGNGMKVRWNACHALGKTLKNENLFIQLKKWQSSVFGCLCDLMEKFRNFKVRSHAAMALKSPPKRCLYEEKFPLIWKAVLSSMESANHIDDFTEYKHKDQLEEQLCVTLCHLACLLTSDDLSEILEPTIFMWEGASRVLRQVAQRVEPQGETCTRLLDAAKSVTTKLTCKNDKQRECLNILQNMFVWET